MLVHGQYIALCIADIYIAGALLVYTTRYIVIIIFTDALPQSIVEEGQAGGIYRSRSLGQAKHLAIYTPADITDTLFGIGGKVTDGIIGIVLRQLSGFQVISSRIRRSVFNIAQLIIICRIVVMIGKVVYHDIGLILTGQGLQVTVCIIAIGIFILSSHAADGMIEIIVGTVVGCSNTVQLIISVLPYHVGSTRNASRLACDITVVQ
ncbi:hypothetical protein D3C72_501380 [compost metagenome]